MLAPRQKGREVYMRNIKRFLTFLLVIMVVIFVSVIPVFAESPPGDVTEFMTWEILATSGGAVLVTLFIVQFLKLPLDKVWKVPTRFIVYLIALILLILYEVATVGILTFPRIPIIVLNAVVVAVGAMGSYELTFRKVEVNPRK
jgi:cell division protein FtsW (lipid II flippase)